MGKKNVTFNQLSEEKRKSLDVALLNIEKQFGKGSVQKMSADPDQTYAHIPTGILPLDIALGIGGLPKGRIVEIYGPESSGKTTLTLHTIAEAQKAGGMAAFIDAEHALDPSYAKKLGVDVDELLVSQPDNGEQALEIAEALIRSNAIDVIVIDSVAALVPRAELDGDMGHSHMGLQARLMSQGLRKLTGVVHNSNTVLIFINQIRMKIGVMFGCFSYNSRVVLSNGTTEKIGKIVNQKLDVEVLSYNNDTCTVESKKIKNWFDNGNAEYFLQFTTQRAGGNGFSRFSCTPNHLIFTPTGEKHADELNIGDKVLVKGDNRFNDMQLSVLYGSLLGDGSLRKSKGLTSKVRFGHGKNQIDYCKWKAEIFSDLVSYTGENSAGGWSFDLKSTTDLTFLYDSLYKIKCESEKKRFITEEFLNLLDIRSVAIWYMDDGSFSGYYDKWGYGKSEISIKSYCNMDQEKLRKVFTKFLGKDLLPTLTIKGTLLFSGERNKQLHKLIAPYIPPCMEYKIHPKFRGLFNQKYYLTSDEDEVNCGLVEGVITDKYIKPPSSSMKKYDIEVEDNHNYFIDNVLVHNSPETTTGGNALKFYASVRLDVRKGETLKKGDEDAYGNKVKVTVKKNKMAPPFRKCEFDLLYDEGYSKESGLLDEAVSKDIVKKAGTWYSYGETRLGQGKENARVYLKDNPDLTNEIKEKVLSTLKPQREKVDTVVGGKKEVDDVSDEGSAEETVES